MRLKDGYTVRFPKLGGALEPSGDTVPLAFTCKDLFLSVGGRHPNVFRIPLDALPPGALPARPPAPFTKPDASP